MARIIAALIRHGDYHQLKNTPSAWQPFSLNSAGEAHALCAAEKIRQEVIKQTCLLHPVCDSSQLLRAWQTAQIICKQLAKSQCTLTVNSFAALAERSVGSAANLTILQIEEIIDNDPRFDSLPEGWKSNSHFCLPLQGAESLMDSGKRVAEHLITTLSALQETSPQNTLKLIAGHGAAFRHAAFHLGILQFEQIAQLSMYHDEPVFIERLADGSWVHIAGKWKIRGQASQYSD